MNLVYVHALRPCTSSMFSNDTVVELRPRVETNRSRLLCLSRRWKELVFLRVLRRKARTSLLYSTRHVVQIFSSMLNNKYLTNRFHVAVLLFSNRSQMTSKFGKNKKVAHEAQPSVSLMFLPHFDVFCDLLLNRRTATWNLFVKVAYYSFIRVQ